jgi:hypothetical protein
LLDTEVFYNQAYFPFFCGGRAEAEEAIADAVEEAEKGAEARWRDRLKQIQADFESEVSLIARFISIFACVNDLHVP